MINRPVRKRRFLRIFIIDLFGNYFSAQFISPCEASILIQLFFKTITKKSMIKGIIKITTVFFCCGVFLSCLSQAQKPQDADDSRDKIEKLQFIENTGLSSVYVTVLDGSEFTDTTNWKPSTLKILDENGDVAFEQTEILAKGRGNSSFTMMGEKKAMSIKLLEKQEILGMKKHKRWVLVPNASDKSLVRNLYAYYLGNHVFNSQWCPSFVPVNLFYNGKYWGVYILGEQIKINKNRVDIQDISDITEDLDGDEVLNLSDGGFICEQNMRMDEAFNFTTKKGLQISLKNPDEVSKDIQNRVQSVIQEVEDAIFSENFKDEDEGYKKYLDVDSFVDWYIVSEFSKNPDSVDHGSVYMYYNPKDKKLYMGPLWDFDLAFGNENYLDTYNPEGSFIYIKKEDNSSGASDSESETNPQVGFGWGGFGGWQWGGLGSSSGHLWFNSLMSDEKFYEKVVERWNERKGLLEESISSVLPQMTCDLEKGAYYNFKRWDVLGKAVFTTGGGMWGNMIYDAPGYENRKTYKSEVDYLLSWCRTRYEWMDSFLNK